MPYGLWSEEVSAPSMEEHVLWVRRLAAAVTDALEHFELSLREDTTPSDVASALASMVEGVWLNQCLTSASSDRLVRADLHRARPLGTDDLARIGRPMMRSLAIVLVLLVLPGAASAASPLRPPSLGERGAILRWADRHPMSPATPPS